MTELIVMEVRPEGDLVIRVTAGDLRLGDELRHLRTPGGTRHETSLKVTRMLLLHRETDLLSTVNTGLITLTGTPPTPLKPGTTLKSP